MQAQTDAAYTELYSSLIQEGVSASSLKLKDFPETGRGLAATRTISPGETLLSIPFRHLINLKTIAKSLGTDWKHSTCPAHAAIAVHILHHRRLHENSSLKHYIHSLPRAEDLQGIPLTWETQECEYLPVSTQTKLAQQRLLLSNHYSLAQVLISNTPVYADLNLTFELFRWAWLIVNSRSIYQQLSTQSTIDDNYTCAALVDMLNHAPSNVPHAKLLYDKSGLTVEAQSSYVEGEEVCISYGAHGNDFLVLEYGFRVQQNADNSLVLDDLILADLSDAHGEQLREMGYFGGYTTDHLGRASFRVEVALRVALLEQDELVVDGQALRRVMQYAQGLNSGRDTEAAVKERLTRLLDMVVARSTSAIESMPNTMSKSVKDMISVLHQDEIAIAEHGLEHLKL
ncbi:hypothetical protein BCR37DRAFT_389315 [Protomyces lactucae-debilis]|uniref:SET domain-containing protein n=1 Tax=Protomyces lactucae-debilis TaxID=2754530 RepID=A0A1Y2EYE6_PROLT|nr:uncharacterized protein BCR37DRAFT_389315 [Protomyces lactucae-debilis]ORY76590.1 hypothetical protein BCR37DRAFT_389315 [Protomyces lactucae-debilis]